MTEHDKIIAGALRLAVSHGFAGISEAVEWADQHVSSVMSPDIRVIDLALSKTNAEAITHLNAISEGANIWKVHSAFLKRFQKQKTMPVFEAQRLSKILYFLACYEADNFDETPQVFHPFVSHWDAIDLAIDGTFGALDMCLIAFMKDVHAAGEHYNSDVS